MTLDLKELPFPTHPKTFNLISGMSLIIRHEPEAWWVDWNNMNDDYCFGTYSLTSALMSNKELKYMKELGWEKHKEKDSWYHKFDW